MAPRLRGGRNTHCSECSPSYMPRGRTDEGPPLHNLAFNHRMGFPVGGCAEARVLSGIGYKDVISKRSRRICKPFRLPFAERKSRPTSPGRVVQHMAAGEGGFGYGMSRATASFSQLTNPEGSEFRCPLGVAGAIGLNLRAVHGRSLRGRPRHTPPDGSAAAAAVLIRGSDPPGPARAGIGTGQRCPGEPAPRPGEWEAGHACKWLLKPSVRSGRPGSEGSNMSKSPSGRKRVTRASSPTARRAKHLAAPARQ